MGHRQRCGLYTESVCVAFLSPTPQNAEPIPRLSKRTYRDVMGRALCEIRIRIQCNAAYSITLLPYYKISALLTLYLILSVSVTVFRFQPPVTLLISFTPFYFLIHRQKLDDLNPNRLHVTEILQKCNLCSSDNLC
jgi:hypothetical protein